MAREYLMCILTISGGSSRISREDSPCIDGPHGLDAAFVDLVIEAGAKHDP